MNAKCKRCDYEWTYKGKKLNLPGTYPIHVQCPTCHTSVKIEREEKESESE